MLNYDEVIKQVCLDRGIELDDAAVVPYPYIDQERLINSSFLIGRSNIVLGIYDNSEYRLISFFHEVGHSLVSSSYGELTGYNKLLDELKAWDMGIECAYKYGVVFSDEAIVWGYSQALTYVKSSNLNLYLLSQNVVRDYDTYDSCVVIASCADDAVNIHPTGLLLADIKSYNRSWPRSPDDINVDLLGAAFPGSEPGVVCASFNAG